MEYEIEELLPIVAKLVDKYTSKESSSVTYETAEMLMGAVIYCIDEVIQDDKNAIIAEASTLKKQEMDKKGCDIVIKKAMQVKEIYESFISDFEWYGCKNYRDTVLYGIPGFLKKYDPKFNPRDHILTMDYPLLMGNPNLEGVNLVLTFLKGIKTEKKLLDLFQKQSIIKLISKIQPEYKNLYLDNLCFPVLLNVIGCIIAERPIELLELNSADCNNIKLYFEDDSIDRIEFKVNKIMQLLTEKMKYPNAAQYFTKTARSYAAIILNGIENNSLTQVFHAN